jgi:nicotinate-nucleotide adenylyltransferase
MLRLGVLGGTFDPIHLGHLIVAEEARVLMGLDRVIFVPTQVSPLKLQGTYATGDERLRMVELAVADNAHFCASRVDLDRPAPSYTVDTLRALQATYGATAQFHFIMGADSLHTFHSWHRPEEIIRLARLIVVSRVGFVLDWETFERDVPGLRAATDVLETLHLGISSTDIRARVRKGWPIHYQVPAAVEAYVREHALYLAAEEARVARHTMPCA